MTEAEWNRSEDAGSMLEYLWKKYEVSPHWTELRFGGDMQNADRSSEALASLDRSLHQFYLTSCRAIWKLLPQEESRRGVELAEQFLSGTVSGAEVNTYNWQVEGAAFLIDYNTDSKSIKRWVAEVRALPELELGSMLHPPEAARKIKPRELLKRAAYSSLTPLCSSAAT